MPLHDWTGERGWDSVYPFWLAYLVECDSTPIARGMQAVPWRRPGLNGGRGQRQARR